MSQEEFAHLSGMDRTHMGAIERGQADIRFSSICKIASTLNIPLPELMDFPIN